MVSGALAGLLKGGAVALTAGGLATGIYLAVQVGEEEDANRAQTVQTPAVTSTALSPPNQVVRPTAQPTITPTYVLAPSPTAPTGVDTSNWKTYESPLGFTLKYPPGWTIKDYESEGQAPGTVKILNETATAGFAERLGAGQLEGAKSGEAWIEISHNSSTRFDVHELFLICGVEDQSIRESGLSVEAAEVTFASRRAVSCAQEGPAPDGQSRIDVISYWIGAPSGGVTGITAYALDANEDSSRLLATILSSVSFEAEP
jgi:hypothetical protein